MGKVAPEIIGQFLRTKEMNDASAITKVFNTLGQRGEDLPFIEDLSTDVMAEYADFITNEANFGTSSEINVDFTRSGVDVSTDAGIASVISSSSEPSLSSEGSSIASNSEVTIPTGSNLGGLDSNTLKFLRDTKRISEVDYQNALKQNGEAPL